MKAREITLGAVILACALTAFVIENQIPSIIPIPGFKIGLSNIFTLALLYLWDKKHCLIILMLRIFIGSFMYGGGITFLYSFSGGMACFAVMSILKFFFGEAGILVVSMSGALAHNAGQLIMAAFVLKGTAVFVYLPLLIALAVASGLFVGILGRICIKNAHIRKLFGGELE